MRFLRNLFFAGMQMLSMVTIFALAHSANAFTPTAEYTSVQVQDFRVLISPDLKNEEPTTKAAQQLLSKKLDEVTKFLSQEQIKLLKSVTFWMEKQTRTEMMVQHPSKQWLIEHGHNPEKAGGIEICNVKNFLAWTKTDQPMSVLHELSHAY